MGTPINARALLWRLALILQRNEFLFEISDAKRNYLLDFALRKMYKVSY